MILQRALAILACFALGACSGAIGGDDPADASVRPGEDAAMVIDTDGARPRLDADEVCPPPPPPPPVDGGVEPPPIEEISPSRLLRRTSLALLGAPPTDAEYDALEAAPDPAQYVLEFVDRVLASPAFYDAMFELARDWLRIPLVAPVADEPEYGVPQQRTLIVCPAGSARAGALAYYRDDGRACEGLTAEGQAAPRITIEPWWAPGTMVELTGSAANTSLRGTALINGNPVQITCNGRPEGTCGCGAHAARCSLERGQFPGWAPYLFANERGHRRLIAEEPARLFAHIAWHDRPATDLVLGSYSVGPTLVQAAYVMQGIEGGSLGLLDDDRWWKPELHSSEPVDPHHSAADPWAWRQFSVPDRNPYFLAERDYRFDPRTERGPMRGVPAAGMLTSLGFLNGYPRERLRAARALEALACEVFAPPSEREFNVYRRDPAVEGPCQTCHKRLDPASIHFKRWGRSPGYSFEGYGSQFFMPGIGPNWHWPAAWRNGAYPYDAGAFAQWNRWYQADTRMTPVTPAQIMANHEAMFIDFLPPDQTLLGEVSDGTVGPLGFGKLIVQAGAFDRCVVRKLHQRVLGRDVDTTREAGYLDLLLSHFVDGDRQVRPFIKYLTTTDLFRRGR